VNSPPRRFERAIAAIGIVVPLLLAGAAAAYSAWRAGFGFDPTLHAVRVTRLRAAQAAGDLDGAAAANADLASEGLRGARACVRAWAAMRDPETGLFPRGGADSDAQEWSGQDTGADLFPHLLYGSIRTAPEEEPTWRAVLDAERRLSGHGLPRTIRLRPMQEVEESAEERVQNAAEFAADGLVPLIERLGPGPWLDRLREIVDQMVATAAVPTAYGPIPSARAETNGNLLQVIARLYPLTRDPRQREMAERIAIWYATDVLPHNGNLPPRTWDFEQGAAREADVKLRDHGGEVIPGLAELHFMERLEGAGDPAAAAVAARLRPQLDAMLRALIAGERTRDGLWLDHINPTTGKTRRGAARRVVDTWGYLANALVMADLAGDGDAVPAHGGGPYHAEVERVMRAVSRLHGFPWEREAVHDGYADSIESMLCLLPYTEVEGAGDWIDDEIAVLLAMQRRDGFVARDYLDGNFVRTALLYAEWKTRGARLEPWREDLRIGGAEPVAASAENGLRLYLAAAEPWSGRLHFDGARHRTSWSLRADYPRRNGSPEWFTVERGRGYVARDLDSGEESLHDGSALLAGVPLTLEPGRPRRLSIEAR
jgi:hypothetical protein